MWAAEEGGGGPKISDTNVRKVARILCRYKRAMDTNILHELCAGACMKGMR